MTKIIVDVRGETCPIPLVEMRKALKRAVEGDVVEITGTHPASKKEIPMAAKALSIQVLSVQEVGNQWTIKLEKQKNT